MEDLSNEKASYDSNNQSNDQVEENKKRDICDDTKLTKRLKLSHKYNEIYLKDLPKEDVYEKSYMHRDIVSHVIMTKTQFLITCAVDGSLKFWKKVASGIEFVRHFNCHPGPIHDVACNQSGSEIASISLLNKVINVFDVINFDMINFIRLDFEPNCIEWTQPDATNNLNLAVADKCCNNIYLFDARQPDGTPKRILQNIHTHEVTLMRFNCNFKTIISIDSIGSLKYWHNSARDFKQVTQPIITFKSQSETDLATFERKNKEESQNTLHDIRISTNGGLFVTSSSDRMIRVFHFRSGKIVSCIDESLEAIESRHRESPLMASIDFLRKMTIEKDINNSPFFRFQSCIFDQSGTFVIYPNIEGIKVVNWKTKKLVKKYGHAESIRPLSITLFQGSVAEKYSRVSSLDTATNDSTIICNAYKKNRFFLYTNRSFEELFNEDGTLIDRDVYNEPKTKEELLTSVEINQKQKHLYDKAMIHTSYGDIQLSLFKSLAPKTVENFCTHSKNDYYNGQIFHRVIKEFMIQTGDPTGTGTGGESIWGGTFEDEICDEVNFDKPFMLAMANCDTPNTNGSQFFISVSPCSYLNKKHTIFGRVVSGMDVCHNISRVRTRNENNKPLTDIKIINIRVYD